MDSGEVRLSEEVSQRLKAHPGDFIYVSDNRWFLGGIRSGHFKLKDFHNQKEDEVLLSEESLIKSYMILNRKVFVEKTI